MSDIYLAKKIVLPFFLKAGVKFSREFADSQPDAMASISFSLRCTIRNVKQRLFPKRQSIWLDGLINTIGGSHDILMTST